MQDETINALLEMNKQFYKEIACEFSLSRKYPWHGWQKVTDFVNQTLANKSTLDVLDLGCGNARFYKHLIQNVDKKIKYCGVDTNEILLEDAQKVERGTFLLLDIIKNLDQIDTQFDLVVVFGITHHIPGSKNREKWFENLANKVKKEGILVVSLWNVPTEKHQNLDKVLEKFQISTNEFEEGDYLLGWNNLDHTCRYCHRYSNDEVAKIKTILSNKGLELMQEYNSDGSGSCANKYLIFKH